jgi:hypothetical protein
MNNHPRKLVKKRKRKMDMKIKAKTADVLRTLRNNREEHDQIVKEARAGYIERARAAVAARFDELAAGKFVSLFFDLHMPENHTKAYDTAIRMLEMHQADEIELDERIVRCLVLNQWEWMDSFLTSNSTYSETATKKLGG